MKLRLKIDFVSYPIRAEGLGKYDKELLHNHQSSRTEVPLSSTVWYPTKYTLGWGAYLFIEDIDSVFQAPPSGWSNLKSVFNIMKVRFQTRAKSVFSKTIHDNKTLKDAKYFET